MKTLLRSTTTMLSLISSAQRSAAFAVRQTSRTISTTALKYAEAGQAEVVLVGCGAPNRGTIPGDAWETIGWRTSGHSNASALMRHWSSPLLIVSSGMGWYHAIQMLEKK
jgi:hypothetical protein